MITDHRIKFNGVWYNTGDEIPVESPISNSPANTPSDNNREQLSKEYILSLKYFSLKSLADKKGIVAKGKKMPQLQKEVLEAYGL